MKNKILLPVITAVDWIVFLAAAATVTILSYEGLTQTAYPQALSVPVMFMDMAFLISVLLHLIHRDKNSILLYGNVFNLSLIIAAYVIKFAGINYAPWMLLFWDMYLMFFYFVRNTLFCERREVFKIYFASKREGNTNTGGR